MCHGVRMTIRDELFHEGQVGLFSKILGWKFLREGEELPPELGARIRLMSTDELERCAVRALVAETLDAVFFTPTDPGPTLTTWAMLVRQLEYKFGELPATMRARIVSMSTNELLDCAERVLVAKTLTAAIPPPGVAVEPG